MNLRDVIAHTISIGLLRKRLPGLQVKFEPDFRSAHGHEPKYVWAVV